MSKLYEKLAATSPDKAFRNAETKAKLEDNKDALVGALTGGLGGAALGTLPAIAGLTARHRAKKRGSKVGKLNNRAKAIMILTPIAGATSGGFAGYNSGALSKSTKDFENHMAKVFGKEEPYKTRDAKDFRDKWNKEHGEKEGYIPSEIRTKDGKKVAFESRLFMEKTAFYNAGYNNAMQDAAMFMSVTPEARRKRLAKKAVKLRDKSNKITDADKKSEYEGRINKIDNQIRKIDSRHGTGYVPGQAQQKIAAEVRKYTEDDFRRGKEALKEVSEQRRKGHFKEIHFSDDFMRQAIEWEKGQKKKTQQ